MDLPSAIFSAACRWQALFELTWLVQGLVPGGVDPVQIQRGIIEPANRRVAAIERLEAAGLFVRPDCPLYHGPDWWVDLAFELPYSSIAPLIAVREISGFGSKVDNAAIDIGIFEAFPELECLALPTHVATVADLTAIAKLKKLRTLVLGGATNDGLAQLAGHERLNTLALDATHVSDEGLAIFGTLPKLDEVSMWHGKFSSRPFVGLKGLRRVELDACTISADFVAVLSSNAQLNQLSLRDMFIPSLDELEKFSELWKLNLTFSNLDDEMLKNIGQLKQLYELRLDGTDIGSKAVAYVSQCTQLRELGLGCSKVGDNGVKSLRSLRELNTLVLNHTGVTDEGILALEDLPKLSTLVVDQTTVDEETVERVVKKTGESSMFLLTYGFAKGMNYGR